jgi:hypothetical protein
MVRRRQSSGDGGSFVFNDGGGFSGDHRLTRRGERARGALCGVLEATVQNGEEGGHGARWWGRGEGGGARAATW